LNRNKTRQGGGEPPAAAEQNQNPISNYISNFHPLPDLPPLECKNPKAGYPAVSLKSHPFLDGVCLVDSPDWEFDLTPATCVNIGGIDFVRPKAVHALADTIRPKRRGMTKFDIFFSIFIFLCLVSGVCFIVAVNNAGGLSLSNL